MANIVNNLMGGMTIEKLSGAFSSAEKSSAKITENLQKANGFASKLGSSIKNAFGGGTGTGQQSLGAGQTGNSMANSLGGFTGGGGGASMTNVWGKFGSMAAGMGSALDAKPMSQGDPRLASVMLGNVTEGVHQMLPDMGATMTRATEYYNATMYAGNRFPRATNGMTALGRNIGLPVGMPSIQDMTLGTINDTGGLTSVGADARVAKYLLGRGMNASGQKDSTYQQTLRTIGNAGKYLNISNESAARSIEGLTSASGASKMLRNFGIYTSDLETGKEKTQGQIFEELYSRMTGGRDQMSLEDLNASFRRGAGSQLLQGAFGNDEAQQEMFKQFAREKTFGSNMDLSNQDAMNKIYNDLGPSGAFGLGSGMASGNANPMNSLYALNSSETNQLDKAEQAYIQGITAAVQPLQLLNDVSGTLAATMAGVNLAFLSTMKTSKVYEGGSKALGSVASWAGGNALELGKAAVQFAMGDWVGAATTAVIPATNLALGTAGLAAMGAAGLATTVAGGGLWMDNAGPVNNKRNPKNEDKNLGGGEALPSGGGEALPSSSGGAMAAPIPGGHVVKGADFNDRTGVYFKTTGRPHMGKDYQASEGSPVYAVTGGKVVKAEGSTKRFYIGTEADRRKSSTVYDGLESDKTFSLGLQVHVLHPSGYKFIYGHLSQISSKVKQAAQSGGEISKNDLIGLSGHSGSTTGPHLHFEVQDKNGTKVNPKTVIDKLNAQANLTGGAAGSTGSAAGSTGSTGSTGSASQMSAAQALVSSGGFFGANAQQIQAIVASLGSGDMKAMQGAVNAMVNLAGGSKAVSSATANTPGTGANTAKGSGNNVNITLQLPDVSESEASKFAKLVKQYLDDGTLQSNMGSY